MFKISFRRQLLSLALGLAAAAPVPAAADGLVIRPRQYAGSLEEKAQEAIIFFQDGDGSRSAVEDLILKITIAGDVEQFAWVVPLPSAPQTRREDPALFEELFAYVEARNARHKRDTVGADGGAKGAAEPQAEVDVLSREIVGSYEVAVVQTREAGALNTWLAAEGYQEVPDADDVLEFYRKLGYVFVCIKVSDVARSSVDVDIHPLRFTFETGGRDAIYFPMRLTGLQSAPFDVNLYVFRGSWVNDNLNGFGYRHHGFELRHRDWDTAKCVANAGKAYSAPESDPYLAGEARRLPTLTAVARKLHPGELFYLTNLQGRFKPRDVRDWSGDLWLFPYYIDRALVPFDARPGGAAYAHWPQRTDQILASGAGRLESAAVGGAVWRRAAAAVILVSLALAAGVAMWRMRRAARSGLAARFETGEKDVLR